MKKAHQQFCALARSLDVVGDRWTLLVIRELIPGSRGFRQIRANLPGMATNLLSSRLKALLAEGLVEKAERPNGKDAYALTESGVALRESVEALVRWGGPRLLAPGSEDQMADSRWLWVALPSLLWEVQAPNFGAIELNVEGERLHLGPDNQGLMKLTRTADASAVVRLDLSYHACLALFGGTKDQRVKVLGNLNAAGMGRNRAALRRWILGLSDQIHIRQGS